MEIIEIVWFILFCSTTYKNINTAWILSRNCGRIHPPWPQLLGLNTRPVIFTSAAPVDSEWPAMDSPDELDVINSHQNISEDH